MFSPESFSGMSTPKKGPKAITVRAKYPYKFEFMTFEIMVNEELYCFLVKKNHLFMNIRKIKF